MADTNTELETGTGEGAGGPSSGSELKELQRKLDQLSLQNKELSASVSKLEAKREELLNETKKRKNLDRLLRSVNIDISDEDAEIELMKRFTSPGSATGDSTSSQEGSGSGDSGVGVKVPSTADLELKAQLKMMKKKLDEMEQKTKEAERREQEAVQKRQRDFVELKVKEALQKAGCVQPNHLFKLQSQMFRLSEDGETVIGGSEADPRSLEDQIESFKDDQEFSMYFRGSGVSGSGMSKGQGGLGGQSLKNPFRSDQRNATEAARIFKADPERAKRLMLEARSAGKLDPTLGRLAGV